MLATHSNTGIDLFLPPMVRFHEVPTSAAAPHMHYAPALSFHQQATAQQALDALRQMQSDVDDVYYLFVTDAQDRLVGVITLRQLICAAPGARLFEFMDQRQITLPAHATLEEQAHLMSESGLLALPVVDERGRLVGAMDASDIIRAIERESTSEMYQLAGLQADTVVEASAKHQTHRTLWLVGNLVVALLAAWLISSFTGMLTGVALLAAFLPLTLRLGQQSGMQSLTLMARSLALGQVQPHTMRRAYTRELLAGLVNGLLIGGLAGIIGWLWLGAMLPGLLIGAAVAGTMLVAVALGGGLPLACKVLRRDPTRISALVLGAVTDLCGVSMLLGLAGLGLLLGYL